MGNWFTSFWDRLFAEKREFKMAIVGLDAAGKSTIVNKMRFDELVPTAPTIGVNTEDIQVKNVNIKVFDLAGQEKMRNVWKYYYSSIDGIIFVIDSSNVDRINDARDELLKVLANDEAKYIPCLIFANKQDLPSAVKGQELVEMLGVGEYINKKPMAYVKLQESSAVHDEGLLAGFEWIVEKMVTITVQR